MNLYCYSQSHRVRKQKKHVKFLVTTVDTKVQLGTLLRRISEHKPLEEWIRDKIKRMLNESLFGHMLRADTPYGDNLSVAKLNQYRKDSNNGPMLTAETLVDLKPFALKLGSFLYNMYNNFGLRLPFCNC